MEQFAEPNTHNVQQLTGTAYRIGLVIGAIIGFAVGVVGVILVVV